MARKAVLTEYSVTEINELMAELFARFGFAQADADIDQGARSVPLEGVPLGDRPAEMRRPRSNFYLQSYLEARCAIRTLVELGLGPIITNVSRQTSPAPDLRVDFKDGTAFVEHAMIIDERANQVQVSIEDSNFRFHELAARDAHVTALLESGALCVLLDYVSPDDGIEIDALAQELLQLTQGITDTTGPFRIKDATTFPLLTMASATANFNRSQCKTWAPMRSAEPFLDRREELAPTFRRMLEQKLGRTYDRACRPLWLLFSVSNGFSERNDVEAIARAIVADVGGVGQFDRLIVQRPRAAPIIFPA